MAAAAAVINWFFEEADRGGAWRFDVRGCPSARCFGVMLLLFRLLRLLQLSSAEDAPFLMGPWSGFFRRDFRVLFKHWKREVFARFKRGLQGEL